MVMIKNEIYGCTISEGYKKYALDKLNLNLSKFYDEELFKNKYILILEAELYYEYNFNKLTADLTFKFEEDCDINCVKNGCDIKNFKIRKPYSNKKYNALDMKKGRRVFDGGIPLIFDTFEDLKKLKSIVIDWEIDNSIYIRIKYDLKFEKDDVNRIYSVGSRDILVKEYNSEYINQFDLVLVNSKEKEAFSDIYVIKGSIQEMGLVSTEKGVYLDGILKMELNDENISFGYQAKEVIKPYYYPNIHLRY